MRRAVYAMAMVLFGALTLTTGCTTKKRHERDIANLQSQIGGLQSEIARLDQQTQESGLALRAAREQGVTRGTGSASALAQAGGGSIYRTPSGFELPATAIQSALKKAGYYQGAVDGKVGSGTKQAIKNFQRDNGLTPDGVCGRQTWSRLQGFAEGPAS